MYREIYADTGSKPAKKPPKKTPAGDPLKNPKDISKIQVEHPRPQRSLRSILLDALYRLLQTLDRALLLVHLRGILGRGQ